MIKRSAVSSEALKALMEGKNTEIPLEDRTFEDLSNFKSKICVFPGCEEKSYYNYARRFPKYCSKHAIERMKYHPRKTCKKPGCYNFALFSDSKHKLASGVFFLEHRPHKGYMLSTRNVYHVENYYHH